MSARLALLASLALAVAHGVSTEFYFRMGKQMPDGVTTVFTLAFCVLAYLWYRADAVANGYVRRTALTATVIMLPFIGLPLYAALSRKAGQKLKSSACAVGFILSLLVLSVGSGVATQIAASAA